MGIYDRDYYQYDSKGFGGGHRSMVVTLVIITAVVYLVDNLLGRGGWLSVYLAADATRPFEVWRYLTYGFLHDPMGNSAGPGIWHIVGNMFVLWMFGREIEGIYGKKEFLSLYLTMMVMGAVIWTGLKWILGDAHSVPMIGASGAVAGVVMLFVLHFPKRRIQLLFPPIPMPAWVFGIFFVGLDALGAMGIHTHEKANVAYTVHLAGAAFAFLYFRSGVRLTQVFGRGAQFVPKRRPKLRVHRGDRSSDLARKADSILQKVHRDGADSITAAEQKILDEYSRSMRQKHSR